MPKPRSLHATPEAVETAFYDALESGDVDLLMDCWSSEEEIACIHPGGPRLLGLQAVAASWREILANGPITVRPTEPRVMQASLVSVHSVLSRVMALVRTEGDGTGTRPGTPSAQRTMAVNVLVTQVFFKGSDGWRLVLHHASVTTQDADSIPSPTTGTLH